METLYNISTTMYIKNDVEEYSNVIFHLLRSRLRYSNPKLHKINETNEL